MIEALLDSDAPDLGIGFNNKPHRRNVAKHHIADIHYSPRNGPCRSVCACGRHFEAANPDALASVWLAHTKRARGARS